MKHLRYNFDLNSEPICGRQFVHKKVEKGDVGTKKYRLSKK
jgi:hypothetical protein